MDVAAEDAEAALDPRIQVELENLNNATDDINKLETELDEAHTAFRQLLSDTTRRLKEITEKLGTSCIEKARCYYEALEMARQAQVQCQQQAQLFQRASEIHAAAKETVALAEARFMSHQHEWNFDQAWQDMLNHATIKVMDADNQKAECGREHHRRAMLFHDAEKKLVQLEEKHRRAIIKARPYFEVKTQCDSMLATQKERVEYLQQTVKEAKRNYARSLRTLEDISNQIHQQRRDYDIVANGPREPGVGAELIGSDMYQKYEKEFSGADGCKLSLIKYKKNEKLRDIERPCSTREDTEHLDKRSVDGSESKFTQWELELQASMEKLNRLSIEKALYAKERESARTSSDLRDVEVDSVNRTCYNLLTTEQFNTHSSNRFSRSTENNPEAAVEGDKQTSHLRRSCSTIDSVATAGDAPTVTWKSNASKSLSNSPVNRTASSLEKKIPRKVEAVSKYVPNRSSRLDMKNRKAQSSWNISTSPDIDAASRAQSSSSTAQAAKTEFPPAEPGSPGQHSAASSNVSRRFVSLPPTRSAPQKSASCSANSSPIKLKKLLTSSTRSSTSASVEDIDGELVIKRYKSKTTSIRELPLLSLFGRASALSALRGKSCSMIDLDSKQNLKTLLDNSLLGNMQAVSAERLANVRHKLVNDRPGAATDNIRK
ncbi:hypothetical protein DMN91_011860 [Ooceraea biroi]|uniref:SH3 domain-binding protein 5-like protein n=1 Tax=Ooceraea biroi TaxID=2015173 RepID=A0A026VVD3_OOCBI|nr:SH3 domain-binding protein 5 homolog [Ooceraea biroi]EZA46794.1 SH3 domain-binding protein 5-like protein [Ooceraea biroi]RLU16102.1 hypothetical protein DMN91_011860 [Ooceraea biroi]